jgi:hypothetical protein
MGTRKAFLLIPALTVLLVAGCSAGKPGVPVEGMVTLDGQPMANVQVLFDQPETKSSNAYLGKTDEQGRYALKPVGRDQSGAAPGSYRVSLTTAFLEAGARDDTPLPPERIPPKYRDGKLKYDVPENGTNEANFELKASTK